MSTHSNAQDLIIIGGGGHAVVVAEAAIAAGFCPTGFLDDNQDAALASPPGPLPCLGSLFDSDALAGRYWILGVGALRLRDRLLGILSGDAFSIVHPSAFVAPSAMVMPGAWIGPGAIVHSRAVIGPHTIINSGAIVEHDCHIERNSHIAPGAILGGHVRVGAGTLVGLGARVLPGLRIGLECTIGAGSVVIDDIARGNRAIGAPARQHKPDQFSTT